MPSSGRIAATSCIPPVNVEPMDDMTSIKDLLYCRMDGVIDKKGGLVAR